MELEGKLNARGDGRSPTGEEDGLCNDGKELLAEVGIIADALDGASDERARRATRVAVTVRDVDLITDLMLKSLLNLFYVNVWLVVPFFSMF